MDSDEDGAENFYEFIAGTDPQLASSKFVASATRTAIAGQIAINFTAQPGKTYSVRYKDAITDPQWTTLEQIEAVEVITNTTVTDTPPAGAGKRFYQVATPGLP